MKVYDEAVNIPEEVLCNLRVLEISLCVGNIILNDFAEQNKSEENK